MNFDGRPLTQGFTDKRRVGQDKSKLWDNIGTVADEGF